MPGKFFKDGVYIEDIAFGVAYIGEVRDIVQEFLMMLLKFIVTMLLVYSRGVFCHISPR